MSEKKELNQEELEKVSGGGDWGTEHAAFLPAGHGIHVAASEAYKIVGQDVYVVDDGTPEYFCWGTLTSSSGSNHSVTVKGKNTDFKDKWIDVTFVDVGGNYLFRMDSHTLYLYQ